MLNLVSCIEIAYKDKGLDIDNVLGQFLISYWALRQMLVNILQPICVQ